MKKLFTTALTVTLLSSALLTSLSASEFDFNVNSDKHKLPITLVSGFHGIEGTHVWSTGGQAEIVVHQNGFLQEMTFLTWSAISDEHRQNLYVTLNNGAPCAFQYSNALPAHSITVSIPRDQKKSQIVFYAPDAVSPRQLGLNDDPRELGFGFGKITLKYDVAPLSNEEALQRALKLQKPVGSYSDETGEFFRESGEFRLGADSKLILDHNFLYENDPRCVYWAKEGDVIGGLIWKPLKELKKS